jgi:hypothetical protein
MERVGGLGGLGCAAQVMSTKKQPLSFWSPLVQDSKERVSMVSRVSACVDGVSSVVFSLLLSREYVVTFNLAHCYHLTSVSG